MSAEMNHASPKRAQGSRRERGGFASEDCALVNLARADKKRRVWRVRRTVLADTQGARWGLGKAREVRAGLQQRVVMCMQPREAERCW